jgi:hypothetical protein
MLYKFRSKAAGDVIMLGANGDQVMRILGRQPAPQGILEVADMPAALAAIEAAIREGEQALREAEEAARAAGEPPPRREAISLRQRTWPLAEMIRRSHAAQADIVWGV